MNRASKAALKTSALQTLRAEKERQAARVSVLEVRAPLTEDCRSPGRFAFAKAAGEFRQVLDCASPLALWGAREMDNG